MVIIVGILWPAEKKKHCLSKSPDTRNPRSLYPKIGNIDILGHA